MQPAVAVVLAVPVVRAERKELVGTVVLVAVEVLVGGAVLASTRARRWQEMSVAMVEWGVPVVMVVLAVVGVVAALQDLWVLVVRVAQVEQVVWAARVVVGRQGPLTLLAVRELRAGVAVLAGWGARAGRDCRGGLPVAQAMAARVV